MSNVAAWEELGNRHINLAEEFRPRPYHRVIAGLAARYCPPEGSVLDLGCGLGQIGHLLRNQRRDCSLVVADAYRECLEITREHVDVADAFLLAEEELDLSEIAGRHGAFDVVVLSHVLEHMLDPVGSLHRVLELVKPGGHAVLAVPNPARPRVLVTNLFRYHYVNRGHVVAWDRAHWVNFLERILKLEVTEYASDSLDLAPSRVRRWLPFVEWIEVRLARLFPWWSFSNIAVIAKPG